MRAQTLAAVALGAQSGVPSSAELEESARDVSDRSEGGKDVMVATTLERAVFKSLANPGGAVLDTASEELATIRRRRGESARELMTLLTQLSQRLERAKASERAQARDPTPGNAPAATSRARHEALRLARRCSARACV